MADSNFKTWLHNSTTKAAGLLAGALLGVSIWVFTQVFGQSVKHLESIDNKFDVLTKDIVSIKMQDSANSIRMSRLEDDTSYFRTSTKEFDKRVGELEKTVGKHEHQLNTLNR